MKVLVSDSRHHGSMETDFAWTVDGELLMLPISVCHKAEWRAECGCDRSFTGVGSAKSCTVGTVARMEPEDVAAILSESRVIQGWTEMYDRNDLHGRLKTLALALEPFQVGDLVRVENTPDSFNLIADG